jgi:hypothetical protein
MFALVERQVKCVQAILVEPECLRISGIVTAQTTILVAPLLLGQLPCASLLRHRPLGQLFTMRLSLLQEVDAPALLRAQGKSMLHLTHQF